ncbi:PrsW family intramembrane metalloprotease [Eubacteriales bacterium OttesenSCG-928-A19]|nr:PrsW family intramembrane metalloprotease [Eubacteriales bacterium OttesenSCG-928-A19]
MIYAENVFICLAAPLIITLFLTRGDVRRFVLFFLLGMLTCLLAAHINKFIVVVSGAPGLAEMSMAETTILLTPICEEFLKSLPLFFFIAVFSPPRGKIFPAALAIGLGFAMMENCCYLIEYGSEDMGYALIRGFSSGIMHTICAALVGFGVSAVYHRGNVFAPSCVALICTATTYHGLYNMLVSLDGWYSMIGYLAPLCTAGVILLVLHAARGFLTRIAPWMYVE